MLRFSIICLLGFLLIYSCSQGNPEIPFAPDELIPTVSFTLDDSLIVISGDNSRSWRGGYSAYDENGEIIDGIESKGLGSIIKFDSMARNSFHLRIDKRVKDKDVEILDKKYFTKSISYDGLHRVETTEYPYEAIRETLLNAIVHRQYMGAPIQISLYDDKIMVWNFGTLLEPMTFEDLKHKHASHPRNSILADVFFKGGLIESWGRGTLKIIDECKSAGLPTPEISEMTGGIVVTIYKDIYNEKHLSRYDLNERQLAALLLWKSKGEIVTTVYAEKFDIGDRTARRDIIELVEMDLLIKTGDLKTSKYLYKGRSVQ